MAKAPRSSKSPSTTNEEVMDSALRHAITLLRYRNSEVERVLAVLEAEVLGDLADRIRARLDRIATRGYDTSLRRTKALQELSAMIETIVALGYQAIREKSVSGLVALSLAEAEWQRASLNRLTPLQLDFRSPSPAILRQSINLKPVEGALVKEWWKVLGDSTAERVKREITKGLAAGESVDEMMRRLRGTRDAGYKNGVLQTSRRDAQSLVRTSVSHIAAQAREEVFVQNEELLRGVMMLATLDARTTLYCMQIDGKVYPVNDGPRPPFHWNCRTVTIAVVKSARELGLASKDIPEGTRASMNGQVPASLTYPQWLKKQTVEFQNEVLGPTRAKLFRSGKFTIDQFVDDRRRAVTLRQLLASD